MNNLIGSGVTKKNRQEINLEYIEDETSEDDGKWTNKEINLTDKDKLNF